MKKIASFLALVLFSAMSFAGTIGAPASIDFGKYSIYGKEDLTDSLELTLNPVGISDWGIGVEVVDDAEGIFWASDSWLYANGTPDYYGIEKAKVYFYVIEAGTFTAKLRLTDYQTETYEDVTLKVVITDQEIVIKKVSLVRVNSLSDLHNGDTIVFVNEDAGVINKKFDGSHAWIDTLKTNVTINKAAGTAEIPETAQMFRATKYSGNWQFTTTDTKQRLHLDITDKGAFTFADTQADKILANWGVSVTSGVAKVSKPDGTFPVEFNKDRFKPYKSTGSGTAIALYRIPSQAAPSATGVKLDQTKLDMYIGDADVTLKATVEPSGADQDVIWESSNTAVATVSANGKVHAVAKGTATITAKVKTNESLKAECALTVNEWEVTEVKFDEGLENTVEIGKTITVSATAYPTGHGFKVTYSSSNTEIATVSMDGGVVKGIAAGDVIITAKSGDKEATMTVHVIKNDPTAIDAVRANKQATKVLREGQVIIIREEKEYDVVGRRVK